MVRPPDSIRGHWVLQCVERFAAIGAEAPAATLPVAGFHEHGT